MKITKEQTRWAIINTLFFSWLIFATSHETAFTTTVFKCLVWIYTIFTAWIAFTAFIAKVSGSAKATDFLTALKRADDHVSMWADRVYDIAFILVLALSGWIGYATLWAVHRYSLDVIHQISCKVEIKEVKQ